MNSTAHAESTDTRSRHASAWASRWSAAALCLGLALGGASGAAAQSRVTVQPNAAQVFVNLPAGIVSPEGITADAQGNLFVGTNNGGATNFVVRLNVSGQVTGLLSFGTVPLLGLEFNPKDGKVYVAALGGLVGTQTKIQRVAANFGPTSAIEDVAMVPRLDAPPARVEMNADGSQDMISFGSNGAAPNGFAFRPSDGALFFSDSFQGAVFRIDDPSVAGNTCPMTPDCVKTVIQDGLLSTVGFPPFGANGLAFSADEKRLFIANTGDDRILALDLTAAAPAPGAMMMPGASRLSVFAESVNGADGLRAGPNNVLIATANQSNQVVFFDEKTGAKLAELGAFLGTNADGSPIGLNTPASVVQVGDQLFITNLALPSAAQPNPPNVFTVSRIQLPPELVGGGAADAPVDPQ